MRQRSREGVVRGNGRPKGCFWRVRFPLCPLRFVLKTPDNLRINGENSAVHFRVLDDRFSARRLLCSFSASRMTEGFRGPKIDPKVLRSGFGLNFYFGLANLGELLANFSANSSANFSRECFGLVSLPPLKFHPQNSRPKLSAFLSNFRSRNQGSFHASFLRGRSKKVAEGLRCNRNMGQQA